MPDHKQLIERLHTEEENEAVELRTVEVIGEAADAIEKLEADLAEERTKSTDATKFSEKAYEEVCAERNRLAAVLDAEGHDFKLAEKCPLCGKSVDDARIDERITNVRFNHPSGISATEGIDLPLALKMAEDNGGSVDVYLSDHESWFHLAEGPAWRIETLRAAFQHAQEQVGEDCG